MLSKAKKFIISFLSLVVCFNFFIAYTEDNNYRVPALLYHNIVADENADVQGLMHITESKFKEHMLALKQAGYTPVLFEDLINASLGRFQLPAKPILITFDDGYSSNYNYAYPILKDFGFKATIFVITSTVGVNGENIINPHFTWDQAAEMQQSGVISIQSHSHTHRDLSLLTDNEVYEDILVSKKLIESSLGTNCMVFSFPYGKFSDSSRKFAELSGFMMQAFVADSAENVVDRYTSDYYRLTVDGNLSGADLVKIIESGM